AISGANLAWSASRSCELSLLRSIQLRAGGFAAGGGAGGPGGWVATGAAGGGGAGGGGATGAGCEHASARRTIVAGGIRIAAQCSTRARGAHSRPCEPQQGARRSPPVRGRGRRDLGETPATRRAIASA